MTYTVEQLLEELITNVEWGTDQLQYEELLNGKSAYEIAHFQGGLAALENVIISLEEILNEDSEQ